MKLLPRAQAHRCASLAGALAVLALVAGCSSTPNRAPIEDRRPVPARAATAAAAAPASAVPASGADAARPGAGADDGSRQGLYTVRPGDTLLRIALDHGQNWRDVQRWNNLDNPNVIEPGQTLHVAPPPAADAGSAAARPVAAAGRVESRPLDATKTAPPASAAAATTTAAASAPAATPAASPPAPAPVASAAPQRQPAREGDDDIQWQWPAAGPVATAFDEARSKGVSITGRAGEPVLAAADGRVVYAGSGLRGYGNLVIVKHNATYLTAYAHNQTLLVKDEQVVRRGQKIAEMGASDADRVKLHFEVRRLGVPIDPLRVLPRR